MLIDILHKAVSLGIISRNVLIEKARSGVYLNTPENKKLGRVGSHYGSKKEVLTIVENQNLTPAEKFIQDKFLKYINNNLPQVEKEYLKRYGNVVSSDCAKELSADYMKNSLHLSVAVHQPSSAFSKHIFKKALASPPEKGKFKGVLFVSGGSGAGKTSGLNNVKDLKTIKNKADIVYDTILTDIGKLRKNVDEVINSGRKVIITHVYRDVEEAFFNGVLPRMREEKRVVPLYIHVNAHINANKTILDIHQEFSKNKKVKIRFVDNSRGYKEAVLISPEEFKNKQIKDFDFYRNNIINKLKELYESKQIDRTEFKLLLGEKEFGRLFGGGIGQYAVGGSGGPVLKSFDRGNSGDRRIQGQTLNDLIEKGRKAQVGEVRVWNGQKMKKVSEYKWLPVNDDKNGKEEQRGENPGKETVGRIEQELSTDFIRYTLGGCCEEYRGEQKAIKQVEVLRDYFKGKDDLDDFDLLKEYSDKVIQGTEALVLFDSDENGNINKVLKGIDPIKQLGPDETMDDFIDRIEMYNKFFPETRLDFRGVGDYKGRSLLLFSQRYIYGQILEIKDIPHYESFQQAQKRIKEENKLYKQVESEMKKRTKMNLIMGEKRKYTDGKITISDVHLGNVMRGADGKLYFIDVNIYYNKVMKAIEEYDLPDVIIKAINLGILDIGQVIEKARSGIYTNTPENRKLGRVGRQYGGEKEEDEGVVLNNEELKELSTSNPEYGREFSYSIGVEIGKQWKPSEETIKLYNEQNRNEKPLTAVKISGVELMIWTGSSGSIVHQQIIGGVAERLGYGKPNLSKWMEKNKEFVKDFNKLGELIYKNTQDYFKSKGIKNVVLYRSSLQKDGSTAGRLFTSWSTKSDAFITTDNNRKSFKSVVPIEQIFSTFGTGFGNSVESEVVVMGEVKNIKFMDVQKSSDNEIEKSKKHPVGTVITRQDGHKYKKVSETGNSSQDWKLVTQDKGKSQEGVKERVPGDQPQEAKVNPKELPKQAKNTSEESLQNAIKQSADPVIRQAAHKELERRQKEEAPQEEKKPGEAKKPEPKKEEADSKIKSTSDDEGLEEYAGVKYPKNLETVDNFKKIKIGQTFKVCKEGGKPGEYSEAKILKKEGSLSAYWADAELDGVKKQIHMSSIFNKEGFETQVSRERGEKFKKIIKEKTGLDSFNFFKDDPDLEIIGSKGELEKNVEIFLPKKILSKVSECHWNASKALQSGEIEGIVIGFVKDKRNSEWVQHTWGVKDGKQVEVTPGVQGEMYFGYKLNDEEAKNFTEATNKYRPGKGKIRNGIGNSNISNSDKVIEKSEKDDLKGGLADNMTIADIAKKHDVGIDQIKKQLLMGVKVEMEHTNDPKISLSIAMDHLYESPVYYTKLKEIEESFVD